MEELNQKLNSIFPGKVVRKDLTKKIKEGANVPVYVLEYLLGMYCATDDEKAIEDGVETVKKILADNFVRSDDAEKVKSKIRENGSYTVIDKITVKLNDKMDRYEAEFSNLGIKDASINEKFVNDYEKLHSEGKCSKQELEEVRLNAAESECIYKNLEDNLWLYKWKRTQCK